MEHNQSMQPGDYTVGRLYDAHELEDGYWSLLSGEPTELLEDPLHSIGLDSIELDEAASQRYSAHMLREPLMPPPWRIGFTTQFRKDVSELDRKLQDRILETLQEISAYAFPFKIKGDTFKPLTGNLKGCWRFRIGDFRLIIKPIPAEAEINVITFSARGDVYD